MDKGRIKQKGLLSIGFLITGIIFVVLISGCIETIKEPENSTNITNNNTSTSGANNGVSTNETSTTETNGATGTSGTTIGTLRTPTSNNSTSSSNTTSNNNTSASSANIYQNAANNDSISKPKNISIKVVKFEPNKPCQGCTNLGNFANETIRKQFPEDYESGKITYETINFQDPKNRQLVEKYKVTGSSLYITVINEDEEEIIDANDMWNYVWKKEEYIDVFKNKLEEIRNKNV